MSDTRSSFRDAVLSCIDRALNIVGDSGRQVVYEALENRYGVKRDEIADHPDYLIKIMKVYLGSASEAVTKEALYWIKQGSGIESDDLLSAISELKKQYEMPHPVKEEPASSAQAVWKMESQSQVPEIAQGGSQSYRYTAKFSFGAPPAKKGEDPDSREALEQYLRSIVDRHTKGKTDQNRDE